MEDSVIGATANVYKRMKTNMEKAQQKAVDKEQRQKTLRQITLRDKEHKDKSRRKTTSS